MRVEIKNVTMQRFFHLDLVQSVRGTTDLHNSAERVSCWLMFIMDITTITTITTILTVISIINITTVITVINIVMVITTTTILTCISSARAGMPPRRKIG